MLVSFSTLEDYIKHASVNFLTFFVHCRENYGCEVVCFTADVGQVCLYTNLRNCKKIEFTNIHFLRKWFTLK